jgi:hypothetical protein
VYGGQLTACILPSLDADGTPLLDQPPLPEGEVAEPQGVQGSWGKKKACAW